jgi:hypothetical protein
MSKSKSSKPKGTTKATKATEAQDVEGQGYLLDPVMASRLSQDRTKAVERSMAERAVQKEARPNKPRQS